MGLAKSMLIVQGWEMKYHNALHGNMYKSLRSLWQHD